MRESSPVTYTVAGRGEVWQVEVRERLGAPARVPGRVGRGAGGLLHVVQRVAVHSIVPGVAIIVSRRQAAAVLEQNIQMRMEQESVLCVSSLTEGIVLGTFFIM